MAAGSVTSSVQPPAGVLRYYADAVNGNDLNDGTSWATAWKTLANTERRISQILCLLPSVTNAMAFHMSWTEFYSVLADNPALVVDLRAYMVPNSYTVAAETGMHVLRLGR